VRERCVHTRLDPGTGGISRSPSRRATGSISEQHAAASPPARRLQSATRGPSAVPLSLTPWLEMMPVTQCSLDAALPRPSALRQSNTDCLTKSRCWREQASQDRQDEGKQGSVRCEGDPTGQRPAAPCADPLSTGGKSRPQHRYWTLLQACADTHYFIGPKLRARRLLCAFATLSLGSHSHSNAALPRPG
jgi:hypothetical protein